MDKNKANVPKLRFPGFTEPWEQCKLNEKVDIIGTGKSKFISNIKETDRKPYAVLGSTSVISYDNEYDYSGDFILTARVGANAGDLYRFSGKVKISDNTLFLQGKNLDFIFYLLTKFNLKNLSFGTGQPLIKASELSNLDLMFPCQIEENKQIGTFLKSIDHLITLHQRKLKHLQDKKKGLLQKMFPKKGEDFPELRFPGFTDPWEQRKLGDEVAIIGTGKSKFASGVQKSDITPYAVLGSTSVISYDKKYDYSGDFVLTARVGANAGDLYKYFGNVKISDNTVFLQGNNLNFIYYALSKYNLKKLSFGTGQPLIKSSELSQLRLKFPVSKTERKQLGNYFAHIDQLIALHQRKLNHLQEQKKALLQQMFV